MCRLGIIRISFWGDNFLNQTPDAVVFVDSVSCAGDERDIIVFDGWAIVTRHTTIGEHHNWFYFWYFTYYIIVIWGIIRKQICINKRMDFLQKVFTEWMWCMKRKWPLTARLARELLLYQVLVKNTQMFLSVTELHCLQCTMAWLEGGNAHFWRSTCSGCV